MRPRPLTDKMKAVLCRLAKHRRAGAQRAGHWLCVDGLVPPTKTRQGNHGLAGFAVLNALASRGFAMQYVSGDDQWAIKMWAISEAGEKEATQLLRVVAGEK